MANSRTKNSVLNAASNVGIKLLTLALSFASRTVFIFTLGAEYLGLNGLFSNILSFLALTELGLGAAISFLLYKPLAINDIERIKVIMRFYRKCYLIIGMVIIGIGVLLMPLLKYLVNLEQPLPENLYVVFFLFVLQSAASYLFVAYKQTLLDANQKKYKLTKYEITFSFINCIVDIIILLIFRNYLVYLVVKLLLVIIKNLVYARKIDMLYPYLKEPCEVTLAKSEVYKIFKDIYSVSVFRLGSVLFNSVTNIVISTMVGTIVVGYYSNYTMIVTQVETIFILAVSAVGASIGNVVATESMEKQFAVYKKLDMIATIISISSCALLIQLLNSFVNLWLGNIGKEYILSQFVVILITANMYTSCSCQVLDRFRTAGGYFAIGRDLQVLGGVLNVIISIFLARKIGFEGVLIAPFLCKMFVTVTPFILRVGKISFGKSYLYMLADYLSKILLLIIISFTTWFTCIQFHIGNLFDFLIEFTISSIIVCGFILIRYGKTNEFRSVIKPIK